MYLDPAHRTTYTNIKTKIPTTKLLTSDMILLKEEKGTKRSGEILYDYKLNVEFWKNIHEPINVVIDEAHAIGLNSRAFASKPNRILTEWLSLIRRVLGQSDAGYGMLVLITQHPNLLDVRARIAATNVRYHICHYKKRCKRCTYTWEEDSEHPEPAWTCAVCNSPKIHIFGHWIEVWHFAGIDLFDAWKNFGMQSFHAHYRVKNVEPFFKLYNTLEWDNLFSDVY